MHQLDDSPLSLENDGEAKQLIKNLPRLVMLRFRGRENAYLFLQHLVTPKSARELQTLTGLSRSAVYDNLSWLRGIKFVRQEAGGTWVFSASRLFAILSVPGHEIDRQEWTKKRYELERESYTQFIRERFGFDRETGEILAER